MADVLIDACVERVSGGCKELQAFMDGTDWVANRSAIAFEQRCNSGNLDACYWLGVLHMRNLGGQRNVIEEALPLYEKACTAKIENSCELAQAYRDRRSGAGSNQP